MKSKWVRGLIVAATVCATICVGSWGFYALMGEKPDETAAVIALAAGILATVIGATAAVSSVTRRQN